MHKYSLLCLIKFLEEKSNLKQIIFSVFKPFFFKNTNTVIYLIYSLSVNSPFFKNQTDSYNSTFKREYIKIVCTTTNYQSQTACLHLSLHKLHLEMTGLNDCNPLKEIYQNLVTVYTFLMCMVSYLIFWQ